MAYDDPTLVTYSFPAATLSTNGIIGYLGGPAGLTGRVESIVYTVTTGVTVAAAEINVGAVADDADNAVCAVPIASANATSGSTLANVSAKNSLAADTDIIVSSDGGCTAGAADVFVTVAWF